MAERVVNGPFSNVLQFNTGYPRIVCTDEYLICHISYQNYSELYAYCLARNIWEVWQTDLPELFHLDMIMIDQKNILIHGIMEDEFGFRTYTTFMGDSTERPIHFRPIGSIETMNFHCNIAVGDSDNLYAVTTVRNVHGSSLIEIFMKRLHMDNSWTRIQCNLQQYNRKLLRDPTLRFFFVSGSKVFIFPMKRNLDKVDFSKLIAIDLRTGRSNLVDLQPANGLFPGFPHTFNNWFNISLAKCPVKSAHAYLVFGDVEHGSSWEVWCVDVDAAQWHRLSPVTDGPAASRTSSISAAIAPSGRLYVLYVDPLVDQLEPDHRVSDEQMRRSCTLFRKSVRVPPLSDQCLDLAMRYLSVVDPNWPRARNIRNIIDWLRSRQRPETDE